MHSILITAKSKKGRIEYALKLCKRENISDIDIFVFDKTTNKTSDIKKQAASIGIDDIKELQKKLFLKPIESPYKAVIIQNAQLLTTEAQNAMLKILEEPPKNTLIVLTSDTKETLLSTILSRCKLIELANTDSITETEKDQMTNQITTLLNMTIPERLAFAESLSKNKEDTILWLENITLILRETLMESIEKGNKKEKERYGLIIKEFQKTYRNTKTTNINLRMTLENLFISI